MKTICTVTGPDGIVRDFEPTNSSSGLFGIRFNESPLSDILPGANAMQGGRDDRNECFEIEKHLFVQVTYQTLMRGNWWAGQPQIEEAEAELQFIVVSDYRNGRTN